MAYQATVTNEADDKQCTDAYLNLLGGSIGISQAGFVIEGYMNSDKMLANAGCIGKFKAQFTPDQMKQIQEDYENYMLKFIKDNSVPMVRTNDQSIINFSGATRIPDVTAQ